MSSIDKPLRCSTFFVAATGPATLILDLILGLRSTGSDTAALNHAFLQRLRHESIAAAPSLIMR